MRKLAAVIAPCVLLITLMESAYAQDPVRQTIRGQVLDRDTQTPLPGANVIVLETEPLLGTVTDADGWFVLAGVPLGRRDVGVSFLGYEPAVVPQVLVTSGKEVVLQILLDEQVLVGEEVVVTPETDGSNRAVDLAPVSARSFAVEETRRYAGGLDDPARMASAFAGVATSAGIQDNAIVIRGNAARGVLWRLEGVEIPTPAHFADMSVAGGGGVTLFSSQLLSNSEFYTGAFPAEFGNALAGVFDMAFRRGNRANREHTLQLGVIGVEAASEGPFIHGAPATYLFNYRYSTLGLILPLLPTEDVASYQDLSFKLSFPTRRLGRIEVWGIGGLDGQSMRASADSAAWEFEVWDRLDAELALSTGATGFSHDLILNPSTYLHTTAAVTLARTRLDQRRMAGDLTLRDDLFLDDSELRVVFGTHLNHRFGARHTNRTGATVQQLFFDVDVTAAPAESTTPVPVARGSGNTTLLQTFSRSRFDLSGSWAADVGFNLQHLALTGHTSIEPRLGLRWSVTERRTLSAGYGLHSQIEDLRIYFAREGASGAMPNRRLAFARAHHGVIGYAHVFGRGLRLSTEAYYQHLFDVPVAPHSSLSMLNFEQDFTFDATLVNEGLGRNYGVETTLERPLRNGYYALLTGSVYRSRYRGGDEVWRPTRFDRGYTANALFGREFTVRGDNLLGLNGRVIVMGGKRRSPVDLEASRDRETVVLDETRAFSEREPAVIILDVTLTYRRNLSRFSDVLALQIKNLLGAKDVSRDFSFKSNRVEEVREGFPLPVLSYKIEF